MTLKSRLKKFLLSETETGKASRLSLTEFCTLDELRFAPYSAKSNKGMITYNLFNYKKLSTEHEQGGVRAHKEVHIFHHEDIFKIYISNLKNICCHPQFQKDQIPA